MNAELLKMATAFLGGNPEVSVQSLLRICEPFATPKPWEIKRGTSQRAARSLAKARLIE
jgi:hypothetical protein